MREPAKLLRIATISEKERGQLSDLLDNKSQTNTFKILENILQDKFLMFLDAFQGDTIKIPTAQQVMCRVEYLRIYNDSVRGMDTDRLAAKYKRSPDRIIAIISAVREELEQADGDM